MKVRKPGKFTSFGLSCAMISCAVLGRSSCGFIRIVTRAVFIAVRSCFNLVARAARTYNGRDSVMSLFGPVGLLALPAVWSLMILAAYTAMFHALGVRGFERAFEMSGSSMFTLGFVRPPDLATTTLAFLEAASGRS